MGTGLLSPASARRFDRASPRRSTTTERGSRSLQVLHAASLLSPASPRPHRQTTSKKGSESARMAWRGLRGGVCRRRPPSATGIIRTEGTLREGAPPALAPVARRQPVRIPLIAGHAGVPAWRRRSCTVSSSFFEQGLFARRAFLDTVDSPAMAAQMEVVAKTQQSRSQATEHPICAQHAEIMSLRSVQECAVRCPSAHCQSGQTQRGTTC